MVFGDSGFLRFVYRFEQEFFAVWSVKLIIFLNLADALTLRVAVMSMATFVYLFLFLFMPHTITFKWA